jgi:hypothetical protein
MGSVNVHMKWISLLMLIIGVNIAEDFMNIVQVQADGSLQSQEENKIMSEEVSELKNCPFCGGKVKYYNGWAWGDRERAWEKAQQEGENAIGRDPSICCEDCGIGFTTGWFGHGISDESAKNTTVEAWNRRVNNEDA